MFALFGYFPLGYCHGGYTSYYSSFEYKAASAEKGESIVGAQPQVSWFKSAPQTGQSPLQLSLHRKRIGN